MLRVLQRVFALGDSDDIFILVQKQYLGGVVVPLRFFVVGRVDVLREVGVHSFGLMVEEVAAGYVELHWSFGVAFAEFDVEAFQQVVVLRVLQVMVDPAQQVPLI